MKKIANLEEYTDDELIIIVYNDSANWQKNAVKYAKHLLTKRGIIEDYARGRIKEIDEEIGNLWQRELKIRKLERYHIVELVLISLFW